MQSSYPLAYDSVKDVAANVSTKIVGCTVEFSLFITSIVCSGTIYAEFDVMIGEKKVVTKRSGPSRNVEFNFKPFPLFVKKEMPVWVSVKHYRLDVNASFEGGIFGFN